MANRYRKITHYLPEWLLTVLAFCRSVFKPVFKKAELNSEDQPINHSYLENGQSAQPLGKELNILSWNILRGYHLDKIKNSLEKLIEAYAIDIIFIQEAPVYELEKFSDHALFKNFSKFYAPVHQVKAPHRKYNFKHSGNLILSRYPFLKTGVYELPTTSDACEIFFGGAQVIKRLAVYSQIKIAGKKIGLYNLHLENACLPTGRLGQAKAFLEVIDNDNDITIAGGDMNTFFPWRSESLFSYLINSGFSWPTRDVKSLRPRLSHFFVKGSAVAGKKVSGRGSDHRPIMIKMQFNQNIVLGTHILHPF